MSFGDKLAGFMELRWVSTGWPKGHLSGGVTVLDVQPDCHNYFMAYIPGAVALEEKTLRTFLRASALDYPIDTT